MDNDIRTYFVLTGTGGQVKGSCVFKDIGQITGLLHYKEPGGEAFYHYHDVHASLETNPKLLCSIPLANKIGCEGQKYALRIADFRKEDLQLDDFFGWESDKILTRALQSFMYVGKMEATRTNGITTTYSPKKAILMPIHPNWFEMILSGEKQYEFRNVLPLALRGRVII